ncbi:MAG TPA: type II secretion system F family protein [Candidatus Polarisedimenticolaceae bacterium]|nr:type II secretion system F family protein [Candidatus Polarisedimenticolaceae bacterium]
MPNFAWKGRTRAGKMQEGVLVADNKDAVIAVLRKQQIMVTGVTEKGKEFALPKMGGSISRKEIAIFTRQFSVMIDAGLPLVQCLEILGSQQENRVFQKILFEVRQDVESGATLADALRKHPKAFDDLYCNMVAAGEAGGILDTILQRLSQYIEKIVKLRSAVRSAMVYPVAVITIAIAVVWIILWKVIPTFATLFAGLGAQLPLPTRITIALSKFIGAWWWLVFLMIGLGCYAIFRYHKTYQGKRVLDKILLKLPVLGQVLKKIAVARFCRTLGTLVSSGVPILDGLEITARTAGNAIVEDAIMATRKSIEEGKTIAEPLRGHDVFPPMVVQMVAVGEQTGALETMLNKIADFYEDEVDEATANLLALLEPIMICFLGVVIGGIVISMYMPMFDLINKIN